MKVVHVSLRFDAPGGVETSVREITRRLRAAGDEVEVFASDLYDEASWTRRADFAPTVDGVPVLRFPVRKRLLPGVTLPMFVGLIDALAESGADVIHAHSHRYGHVLQAALVAERCGIPLVVSTHYHPADRREPGVKRGLLRLQDVGFGMTAYRVAARLVVESELESRLVREFAPEDRVRVVPPGVELAEWESGRALDRPPPGLPTGYVLFVGRIASNKGLGLLLDALAELPPEHRPPLVLMGPDWGERSGLEARADRLGLAGSVTWLGPVADRPSYRAVVRGASALVLPSEWEAFGLVLLDAMGARVPVVATAVGAVPEVLDGGRVGRLVPYGDPHALAAALREVAGDPAETAARVARAATWVRQFDWSVSVERLRGLYREVARR